MNSLKYHLSVYICKITLSTVRTSNPNPNMHYGKEAQNQCFTMTTDLNLRFVSKSKFQT